VPSPSPGTGAALTGVAAISAKDAWAVGTSDGKTLILRWNGKAWKRLPSPSPGTSAGLAGVAAFTARAAWAVGDTGTRTGARTLILRWNGTSWKRVPGPSPGTGASLAGVAGVTARSAWAVGTTYPNSFGSIETLILGWNGKAWKQVPGPNPGGSPLFGVAAVSAHSSWAVGCRACEGGPNKALVEHWNGKAWKQVPSPETPPPAVTWPRWPPSPRAARGRSATPTPSAPA